MDAQQQSQQQALLSSPMSISISTATTTATTSTGVSLHGRPGYAILIKDEKNNTVRLVQASTAAKPMVSRTTAITLGTSTAATATPQVHYVSTSGLSKEAGLELASHIAAFKAQQIGSKAATHSMVAVPISSPTGIKMSALKAEATILPKPAPGNVQRIVTLAASPKTPSSVPTAASADSTAAAAAAAAAAWASKRVHDYAGSEVCDFTKRHKRVLLGGLSCTAAGKGLRHFSMKVCEKVQRKGVTSYNEVADELVAEFSDPQRSLSPTDQAYDQKNIRRRVYDALNVLMAMNIISKEKKEIRWLGLPTNSAQECENLEAEKNKRLERIRAKTQHLHELILQQIAFKNLVQRNKQMEKMNGTPMANSAIHLPFIIVNTSKKTVIDCSISADKMEYLFSFDNTFEIHDDIEVLKRMGMTHGLERGECPATQLDKLKKMVPKSLENYVDQIAEGGTSRLTSTSIVAGPSGLLTGRPIGVLSTTSADTRMRVMTHDVASRLAVVVEDAESIDTPTASMQLATTSDEDDFSESEMEVEDDEDIMIDAN